MTPLPFLKKRDFLDTIYEEEKLNLKIECVAKLLVIKLPSQKYT